MKISVIGTGHIGLVTALTLAQANHEVMAVDCDISKINQLNENHTPIFEPGLSELLKKTRQEKKIIFTTQLKMAAENSDVFFITVGTPTRDDCSADLSFLKQALFDLYQMTSTHHKLVVIKSTVPPGTTCLLQKEFSLFKLMFNPEFIREGSALEDAFCPDRIVMGSNDLHSIETLKLIYKTFVKKDSQFLVMDPNSAELSKYAANSFLAARVSLINEFSQIAEKCEADIDQVSQAIGLDSRIGSQFLKAGIGYGGSCFPKDLAALNAIVQNFNLQTPMLAAIEKTNTFQMNYFAQKILSYFQLYPELEKKITVWGISFKPQTNDLRASPALKILTLLIQNEFKIQLHDPESLDSFQKQMHSQIPTSVTLCSEISESLIGSQALVILTDWPEYSQYSLQEICSQLSARVIFDGRNIFNPIEAQNLNIHYESIGRPV